MALEQNSEEVFFVFREGTDIEVLIIELSKNEGIFFKVGESFEAPYCKPEGIKGITFEALMVNRDPVVEVSARVIVSGGVVNIFIILD